MTLTVIHSPDYADWVFDDSHPTQGRRFTAVVDMLGRAGINHHVVAPRRASLVELERVHDPTYVAMVESGWCEEWTGERADLARLARYFAGGTLRGAEMIWRDKTRRVFHAPGAKHHAMKDHSSGFCVYNDFALAANWFTRRGWRVAIVDFDAHHGDGTESLLRSNGDVLTFSVHDSTIFPGTGSDSIPGEHVYNVPLPADAGDTLLIAAMQYASELVESFAPDILMVAAGADGHMMDPLSTLEYTSNGFDTAGQILSELADKVTNGRMLMGGAGGYCPDDFTPLTWFDFLVGTTMPHRPIAAPRPNLRLVK